jgi:hypothetical protein
MSYAENTSVPVDRSRAEIDKMLRSRSAQRIYNAEEPGRAIIGFEMSDRRIQFDLNLPNRDDYSSGSAGMRRWEQDCRARWRALVLTIKAKFVSMETEVETMEEAFLAQIVVPGQGTMAKWAIPAIAKAYAGGEMPPLLPARGQP